MSRQVPERDRIMIQGMADLVFGALRSFHAGIVFTEIECLMAPPRLSPTEVVPERGSMELDGEDVLVVRGDIQLRFRRSDDGSWSITSAAIACASCETSGVCPSCADTPEVDPSCACAGTALCPTCQGVGRVLFF